MAGDGIAGLSGDGGPATNARLDSPNEAVVDSQGNVLIADTNNNRVRRIDAETGVITTFAGNGSGRFSDGVLATDTGLWLMYSVALDADGNVYVPESTDRVRRIDAATGIITTVAGGGTDGLGDGGPATEASIHRPHGVAVDRLGNIFIADTRNSRVRMVDGATGIITTVAGSRTSGFGGDGGLATSARLGSPHDVFADGESNLYIPETGNHRVRRVDAATGVITTVAGNGSGGFSGDGGPATSASLQGPHSLQADAAGNLFIADTLNARVRRVDATSGVITTVAGGGTGGLGDGGPATSARIAPHGVAPDPEGNLLIADRDNHRVRRVDAATGVITTFAGNGDRAYSGDGGPATEASLHDPQGVAVDPQGNVFIADAGGDPSRGAQRRGRA